MDGEEEGGGENLPMSESIGQRPAPERELGEGRGVGCGEQGVVNEEESCHRPPKQPTSHLSLDSSKVCS